jgi:hypothetical protein
MKPRSWAVFIGVAALLAITFVVGRTGPTLADAAARDTSVTVKPGDGQRRRPGGQCPRQRGAPRAAQARRPWTEAPAWRPAPRGAGGGHEDQG